MIKNTVGSNKSKKNLIAMGEDTVSKDKKNSATMRENTVRSNKSKKS